MRVEARAVGQVEVGVEQVDARRPGPVVEADDGGAQRAARGRVAGADGQGMRGAHSVGSAATSSITSP